MSAAGGEAPCPTAFRDVALRLHANTYRIIPIAPKGFEYHSDGKLKTAGGKGPVEPAWQTHGHQQSLSDVKRLIRKRPEPSWGLGIIAAYTPGLDIDVRDDEAAKEIHKLADRMFGTMPVRYGAAPKRLLAGRTDTPFPKLKTRDFKLLSDAKDAKPHKVEVLCDGQQFVAFAVHPDTNKPYWWDGASPLDVPAADLPLVTQEAAAKFVEECEAILLRHGGQPIKKLKEHGGDAPKESSGQLRGDPEKCRSALAAIKNDSLDRDDWAYMCYVVKGAFGDEGYEPFLEWSKKSPKHHDPETVRTLWDSTPIPDRVGAGTLFYLAGLCGWKASTAVAELNKTFALILVGDKAVVLKEGAAAGEFSMLTVAAFRQWHANRFVKHGKKKDGEANVTPIADYWLTHRDRRQYEGLVFAPGHDVPNYYNLWHGFAVEPRRGDCSKFLTHVRDNVCRGDEALFAWVVGWFAEIVQHPERKSGTSLAIRGKQGTGKTKVGEVIGSLFGAHYVAVADPRFITGRFNSHLVSCLLLHADEGFWAGDHAAEGKLKDLITGQIHYIEYKGKEAIPVRNYVRLLVTGNPDWIVPAGMEERRFATLEIGEAHMKDTAYFAAIDDEMKHGGRAALLHHLLTFDLSQVNLREIPKTAALLDQKIASLTPEQGWWLDVLQSGRLPWGCGIAEECAVTMLADRYIEHASKHGARRRASETALGIFLRKVVPHLHKRQGAYRGYDRQEHEGCIYTFPMLWECRASFAKALQHEFSWDGPEEWLEAPEPQGGEADQVDRPAAAAKAGPPSGWEAEHPPAGDPITIPEADFGDDAGKG